MGRRIFVGDVQGCRAELERLLERAGFDPARDVLHPVGDLVNRGPDSLGALRLLRRLDARAVLGNHDVHLLRVAAGLRTSREGDTIAPILGAPDRDDLLAWLRGQPWIRDLGDVLLVHAGIHPRWTDPVAELANIDPLAQDPRAAFATLVRHCDPEGNRPEHERPPPPPPFAPWFEYRPPDRRTIVWGHWAERGLVVADRLRGLDTGCVWGGRLTAWIAEEDRLVHVDAERRWAVHGS